MRSKAPRKKDKKPKTEVKGHRLAISRNTSNKDKFDILEPLFGRVTLLKNRMASHLRENLFRVLCEPAGAVGDYRLFNDNPDLSAWDGRVFFDERRGAAQVKTVKC